MIKERRKIGEQIVGLDGSMMNRMMPHKEKIRPIMKRHTIYLAIPNLRKDVTRAEEVQTPLDERIVGVRTGTGISNRTLRDEATVVEACRQPSVAAP